MKIRGERECKSCHTRWSYYETGSVGCPACGSLHSVGLDNRSEHTDTPVILTLTSVRNAVDELTNTELASRARDHCRTYRQQRGFLRGGSLRDLDESYLAAGELEQVADILSHRLSISDAEELYFLTLLREADDGNRPAAAAIPPSLHVARGLATATAVDTYRRELKTWLTEHERDLERTERATVEALGDHVTRIQLLEGDIPPETAETLVRATRELTRALRDGEKKALATAQDRLERLW